ncbi:DNA repair protein [Pseudoalteromonas sp. 3-MNA-CIBAN-0064]|uniref:DNA repair protein n=1 Tax=unclassified Pseudoalteromonas TaxID=194690 RepID=UPI003318140B|tara:strand:- start:2197 stop:3120 length:924 start_codon:yes stop_codon:yes gene_type:complete
MSWFSKAKSWASSVCSSIKNTVSKVADKVKETCSKVWNAFTGKHYTDEAEAIYDEINERYDKARSEYQEAVKVIGKEIDEKISKINLNKKEIYENQFERFKLVASRIHNVTVKGLPFEDFFDSSIYEINKSEGLRKKDELVLIDFDQMGFVETAGMILTLGFFSRKKAKESLERVKQERERVFEEIEKMKAQQVKLSVVSKSIDSVVDYFAQLIRNYSILLDRFEFGIQSQRVKQLSNSDNVYNLKLDFKLLPVAHIEEFQALFNLSIVLKQMANLGYLNKEGEVVDEDIKMSEVLYHKVTEAKLSA